MEKETIRPIYSPAEETDIATKRERLIKAKNARDTKHKELNGLTYLEYYNKNEELANTFMEGKDFGDVRVSSGTVEQKLFTVAAEINRLNLAPEHRVFDKEDRELTEMGQALTDIDFKLGELEGDEDKKLLRQVELLKQGVVFVQDRWVREYKKEKSKPTSQIGKVKGVDFTAKLEKVWEGARRDIMWGPGVYPGNVKEWDWDKQPYFFTHKITSYQEAEGRYGGKDKDGKNIWERWKHVPKKKVPFVGEASDLAAHSLSEGFALEQLQDNQVEEVHYEDRFNNEYQIFLNGVAMLPVGFPLSAISPAGEYSVVKQVLQVINPFFVYGRSFVFKLHDKSMLIDELIRLLFLKTRKSITPPYANLSGKVIQRKSLLPGAITMNLDPNTLIPIGQEGQGATASEYQMLSRLQDNLDKVSVSPQMQGQQGKSGMTAYETSVLKEQAQKVLSLLVFACIMLEKKLGQKRLQIILDKYFDPVDTKVDEVKKKIRNVYRQNSRRVEIDGAGRGIRQVVPTEGEDAPTEREIMDMEDFEGTPEPREGQRRRTRSDLGMEPVRKIFLNVPEIRKAKLLFYTEVDSRPKDTSNNDKMMFREELRDIAALASFGSRPRISELEAQHATVWKRRKEKLFEAGEQAMPQEGAQQNLDRVLNENSPGVSTAPEPPEPPEPPASIG